MAEPIDVSTTAVEKMAFAHEQAVRRMLGDPTARSAEAAMLRALAADRDRLRFARVPGEDRPPRAPSDAP